MNLEKSLKKETNFIRNILCAMLISLFLTCSPLPGPTPTPSSEPTPSPEPTSSPEPDYEIRDIGPAGGWIFYDKGNYSDGWRYMEAAPEDQTPSIWGTYGLDTGVREKAVGTGKQNTIDILAIDPAINKAVDRCVNYSVVNNNFIYNDWFLPSIEEINQMALNLYDYGIGDFIANPYDSYWSSSECLVNGPGEEAYAESFNAGFYHNSSKKNFNLVRAARSF